MVKDIWIDEEEDETLSITKQELWEIFCVGHQYGVNKHGDMVLTPFMKKVGIEIWSSDNNFGGSSSIHIEKFKEYCGVTK